MCCIPYAIEHEESVQVLYFGGINLFLLRLFLKELTVFAFLIFSGRLFQAHTVEGKNELKNIFVRVRKG